MKVRPLSKYLYKINEVLTDERKLAHMHDGNNGEMCLFSRSGEERGKEYQLVVGSKLFVKGRYRLLMFEYNIDDGGRQPDQQGDLLMFDTFGKRLVIAEVKRIGTSKKRLHKVEEQAIRCARRIRSWLSHLGSFDEGLVTLCGIPIGAMIITEGGAKELELPGLEPGSSCTRATDEENKGNISLLEK